MKSKIIDTNVIVRFLTEKPETIDSEFKGVFNFFIKLEKKEISAYLPDLVLFESFFVLTSYYEVDSKIVAGKLADLILLSGIDMKDKVLILSCLEILKKKKIGLVDAYLCALARKKGDDEIYSYDKGFKKLGISLGKIE